jgi:8-oxo-dGTP pyrophosphatase MutT (NUDIX family)
MTTEAAGILLKATSTDRYLFLQEHDGVWVTPGGRLERGEDERAAALRELYEETGYDGQITVWHLHRTRSYTLFEGRVSREFRVRISSEHSGHAWRRLDALPEPLHPGLRAVL